MVQNSVEESVSLSAAARVIYQLGEELISDEFVALAELIKNSYDADSTYVKIDIDTNVITPNGIGRITIEDNGNGMTKNILTNSFLRISTKFKKEERFSPHFGRRVLGEKGLGRLSIQRLGENITVITSPRIDRLSKIISKEDKLFYEQYNKYILQLDWKNQFLDDNKDISDVKATCKYENDESYRKGTLLVIEGIRNLNFWLLDKKSESRIRKEIFGMVSPFTQNNKQKFIIKININGTTISNKTIDEEILDIASDIRVNFNFTNWNLSVNILYKKKYFYRLLNKLINTMQKNEFDDPIILKEYGDYQEVINIDLRNENFRRKYPYLKDNHFQQVIDDGHSLLADPGKFEGYLYVLDQSTKAIKDAFQILREAGREFVSEKEIKAIWDAAIGVYIFRNEFRILPYGPNNDWLLYTQRSQREKANAYKTHTVSGYVNLDSFTTENLKEQTNRQGLIEDEYGTNFLILMRDIVSEVLFQKDMELRRNFSINISDESKSELSTKDGNVVFKRKKDISAEKKKVFQEFEEQISVIAKKSGDVQKIVNSLVKLKEIDDDEKKENKQKYFEYEQKIENLKTLAGLAGQGIIVEALTHELHRIEKNIKIHAKESKSLLSKMSKENPWINEVIEKQNSILHEILFLNQQLVHLEPTYKKNRVVLQEINLYELFEELYIRNGIMARKAREMNIRVLVKGDSFKIMGNKGLLITIFDNLFLNSLFWLDSYDEENKIIVIDLDSFNKSIIFFDNGVGINKEIENRLFEPYESLKPEGRGLGLYICKELVKSLKAQLSLDTLNRNKLGNSYRFVIKF